MPHLKVTLQAIRCVKTEDASVDEIYVVCGHGTAPETASGTPPKIKVDKTRFPTPVPTGTTASNGSPLLKSPTLTFQAPQLTMFDEVVLEKQIDYGLHVVRMSLFDEDAEATFTEEELAALTQKISASGFALAPYTAGKSVVIAEAINLALNVAEIAMNLDSDDLLGSRDDGFYLQPTAGVLSEPELFFRRQVYLQPHFRLLEARLDGAIYDVAYKIELSE